jgi:mRNA interferase MazF
VLPLTSELHDAPLFRIAVPAGKETGLRPASQVMADKATTIPRAKVGPRIGRVSAATMLAVEEALRGLLDL